MESISETRRTSPKPWRVGVYVFAALVLIVALIEVGTWARWKYHFHNWRYGGVGFAANGQRAEFDSVEDRWDHCRLHVVWKMDGTVDREASFRAYKRVFQRALSDAEVAHFENLEWGACADTYLLASAIEFFQRQNGHPLSSLEELLAYKANAPRFCGSPLPRDRFGRTYGYDPAADGRPARLFTLGADAAPGGEGLDADWYGELDADGSPTSMDPLWSEDP